MYCTKCGKQINDDAVICVNCGLPTRKFNQLVQPNYAFDVRKTNALGVAGFVVGLCSLFGLPFVFAFFGALGLIIGVGLLIIGLLFCSIPVIGIILSTIGMVNAKKYKPSGLASAGLILSILACLLWVFVSMIGILVLIP